MTRMAGRFSLAVLALLVSSIAPVVAVPAEAECSAEIKVELAAQEEKDGMTLLRFEVELEAAAECSALSYDLLIEEMLPNKQTKIIRMPREVELEDGARSETVEHATDLEMLGYDASLVACSCATPPETPDGEGRP